MATDRDPITRPSVTPPTAPAPRGGPAPGRDEEPAPTRLKRLIAFGAELVIAVAVALLFFVIFLGGLTVIMPSGVTLRSVVGPASYPGVDDGDRTLSGSLDGLGLGGRRQAATLTVLNNEVKRKSTGEIAWGSARSGLALQDGDAVQTTRDGTALLKFTKGEELQLGRNSLMVVRTANERPTDRTVRSSVLVLEGDLWAGVDRATGRYQQMSVATPTTTIEVGAGVSASPGARIKVAVGRDKSSTISVYDGTAELTAGGRRIRVGANQFVRVDSASVMSAPAPLPAAPVLAAPARDARFDYRELPPRVRFDWAPVGGVDDYRLVVSRTPDFHTVLFDRRLSGTGFTYGNLESGAYSWRVSAFRTGAEGPPSETRSITVEKRATAPALQVEFPPDVIDGDACTITGVTEPGNRVFVAGVTVQPAESGRFERRVQLKRGFNVLVVETHDRVGNAAYRSKVVEAKF